MTLFAREDNVYWVSVEVEETFQEIHEKLSRRSLLLKSSQSSLVLGRKASFVEVLRVVGEKCLFYVTFTFSFYAPT